MQADHYEVLGCSKESTHIEIKRAYHARLLQLHPDKNETAEDAEFHRVIEAWRVLGHSKSRKEYDAILKQKELEDGGDMLVYARPSRNELEKSVYDGMLCFRCRCGGRYLVEQDYLCEDIELEVMCDSCTLIILIKV